MKTKANPPKKSPSKAIVKKRRKKIYLNDVAWYYADDPADKRKTIEVVEMLKKIDFSILLERDRKAEAQSERGTTLSE